MEGPDNYMEVQPEYVWRKAKVIAKADRLIQLKNDKGPWAAIELIFEDWKKTNPTEYEAFIVDVGAKQDTRSSKTGASRDKNSGLRYTMDIPAQPWAMIKVLFGDKEMIDPYSKEFFRELGYRFPFLKVAERL